MREVRTQRQQHRFRIRSVRALGILVAAALGATLVVTGVGSTAADRDAAPVEQANMSTHDGADDTDSIQLAKKNNKKKRKKDREANVDFPIDQAPPPPPPPPAPVAGPVESISIITANTQGVGSTERSVRSIHAALEPRFDAESQSERRPDIVLVQETRHTRIHQVLESHPNYRAYNPGTVGTAEHEVAVIWKKDRFDVVDKGWREAYHQPGADPNRRAMVWVKFRDVKSQREFVVVSVHYPKASTKNANARKAFDQSNIALRELSTRFANVPFLAGGDWNAPLRVRAADWQPVKYFNSIGLRSNWRSVSRPKYSDCNGTTDKGGTFIDGFAVRQVRLMYQQCIKDTPSDHRFVRMEFIPRLPS